MPEEVPVVVLGDGTGSYWRLSSQSSASNSLTSGERGKMECRRTSDRSIA
jgi:hypothetical protein